MSDFIEREIPATADDDPNCGDVNNEVVESTTSRIGSGARWLMAGVGVLASVYALGGFDQDRNDNRPYFSPETTATGEFVAEEVDAQLELIPLLEAINLGEPYDRSYEVLTIDGLSYAAAQPPILVVDGISSRLRWELNRPYGSSTIGTWSEAAELADASIEETINENLFSHGDRLVRRPDIMGAYEITDTTINGFEDPIFNRNNGLEQHVLIAPAEIERETVERARSGSVTFAARVPEGIEPWFPMWGQDDYEISLAYPVTGGVLVGGQILSLHQPTSVPVSAEQELVVINGSLSAFALTETRYGGEVNVFTPMVPSEDLSLSIETDPQASQRGATVFFTTQTRKGGWDLNKGVVLGSVEETGELVVATSLQYVDAGTPGQVSAGMFSPEGSVIGLISYRRSISDLERDAFMAGEVDDYRQDIIQWIFDVQAYHDVVPGSQNGIVVVKPLN